MYNYLKQCSEEFIFNSYLTVIPIFRHNNFVASSSLVTAIRTSEKSQQNVEINSHKSGNLVKILNIFEKYLKMVYIIIFNS